MISPVAIKTAPNCGAVPAAQGAGPTAPRRAVFRVAAAPSAWLESQERGINTMVRGLPARDAADEGGRLTDDFVRRPGPRSWPVLMRLWLDTSHLEQPGYRSWIPSRHRRS